MENEKGKQYQFDRMTPEERAECGRRGGIASGEAKRRKKVLKETLEVLLSMPLKSGAAANIEEILSFADVKGKNINVQEAMMIAQIQKALKGDTNAATFVRDTAGQAPKNDFTITGTVPVIVDDSGDDECE